MKVFINKRDALYSGGIIIVAANNVEEAQRVLLTTFPEEINMFDGDGDICFSESECVTREHWHYKSKNWNELPGVTASFEKPAFLAEDGHSE